MQKIEIHSNKWIWELANAGHEPQKILSNVTPNSPFSVNAQKWCDSPEIVNFLNQTWPQRSFFYNVSSLTFSKWAYRSKGTVASSNLLSCWVLLQRSPSNSGRMERTICIRKMRLRVSTELERLHEIAYCLTWCIGKELEHGVLMRTLRLGPCLIKTK